MGKPDRIQSKSRRPAHHWSGALFEDDPTPRLGVAVVAGGDGSDCIECLESLLHSRLSLKIVVVADGTAAATIGAWARGERPVRPAATRLAPLVQPACAKPVPLAIVAGSAAPTGPLTGLTVIEVTDLPAHAAASNDALRHLLADPELSCFWLLDQRCVVTADAASAMLARLQSEPRLGWCGTVIRHYHAPDRLVLLNGFSYRLLTGNMRPLGGDAPVTLPFGPQDIADATDCIAAASQGVSRAFLTEVGLLAEDYDGEIAAMDWAMRNRRLGDEGFDIGFAHGALVYLKASPPADAAARADMRSPADERALARTRLKLIARFRPWLWPWHWLLGWAQALRLLFRRQPANALAVLGVTLRLGR
jgi:hypothetical protein